MNARLEAALKMAELGFWVFPLRARGKRPIHKRDEEKGEAGWQELATRDPQQIFQWFSSTPWNVGAFTSRFRDEAAVLCVDIDNKNGKLGDEEVMRLQEENGWRLPPTLEQRTPSGGRHLIYWCTQPVRQSASKIAAGIDIRSRGGLFVVAGSQVLSGTYKSNWAPVAQAPDWLITACGVAKEVQTTEIDLSMVDQDRAVRRATEYLRTAAASMEGAGGDDLAYRTACKVKDMGVPPDECLALMLENWNERCEPPWDTEDLEVKVRNAYRHGQNTPGSGAIERQFPPIEKTADQERLPGELVRRLLSAPGSKSAATVTENVRTVLETERVTVYYDVIAKAPVINVPGLSTTIDNRERATMQRLIDMCVLRGLAPDRVPEMVLAIADNDPRNVVGDWIRSKPWDGEDRISRLLETIRGPAMVDITYPDGTTANLKRVLLQKWMASAVGALFETNGIAAQGVLVFTGAQHKRKTTWFKRLVPSQFDEYFGEGAMLDPKDRDSVATVVCRWIVELGELDSTFSKSDLGQLKAFITKDRDTIRRPYARTFNTYPRRTVFGATVNEPAFLRDKTGNRRYWTIPITSLEVDHGIDLQQLWAQVYEAVYVPGNYRTWCLEECEVDALNFSNEEFTEDDPLADEIAAAYDWSLPATDRMTVMDAVRELGLDRLKNAGNKFRTIATRLGAKSKKSNGTNWILLPPRLERPRRTAKPLEAKNAAQIFDEAETGVEGGG